jgi:threonine/homoserine/homoserine lactone efflux protein
VLELNAILLFMTAGVALNLTPGPDMLYVAARSSGEGREAGVVSALGIATGALVHTAALALGLSALLGAVPVAYDVVRFAGAGYLVYLGIRALADPTIASLDEPLRPSSLRAVFRQGVLTNVLNPKVALFFLAFLPQFTDPSRGNPAAQIVFLGLLFNTTGTLVNLGVAVLASRATGWLRAGRAARALQRVTGSIFIALGLRLAIADRRVG